MTTFSLDEAYGRSPPQSAPQPAKRQRFSLDDAYGQAPQQPQPEPPLFANSFEEELAARNAKLAAEATGPSALDTAGVRQLPAIREQVLGQRQIPQGAVQQAAGALPQPSPPPTGQRGLKDLILEDAGAGQPKNPFEGVPDDQARKYIASLPEDQKDAALNLWADAFVARERAQGGVGYSIDNAVRGVARGTPIGSFLDEANALGASLTGGSYDEALAYQRARDRSFDTNNPITSLGLQVAGGVASGGVAAKALGLGAGGGSLAAQAGRGAATGAAAGGLYGFGLGEGGAGNRTGSAVTGATIGGVLGTAAPYVAQGLSNAYSGAVSWAQRPGGVLSQYAKGAVNRVAQGAANDGVTQTGAQRTLQTLGPEGAVLDLGPNLRAQAAGIAATPSPGMKTIADTIRTRSEGAESRIGGAINAAVGPDRNVPKIVKGIEDAAKRQYGPLYEQFRKTPVPVTPELQDLLGRITNEGWPIREAYRLASSVKNAAPKQFFAEIAQDGTVNVTRVPNATEWDYLKRALDITARYGKGDGSAKSYVAKSLSGELKDAVDSALSPGAPDKSIYAQARKLFADKEQLKEAVDAGRSAFTRQVSPDELAEEMANLSKPERDAFLIGARQYLADVMGNAGTKFGSNADSAAMRALGTNYAAQKIRMLAPKDQASRLLRRLRTEARFAGTDAKILANSETALRTEAQKQLPRMNTQDAIPGQLRGSSAVGLALEGLYRGANLMTGGVLNARAQRQIADMASMLSAQGVNAQQIAKELVAYNARQGARAMNAQQVGQAVKAIINGSRQYMVPDPQPQKLPAN